MAETTSEVDVNHIEVVVVGSLRRVVMKRIRSDLGTWNNFEIEVIVGPFEVVRCRTVSKW